MDADTRSLVRRSVSNARRRLTGAELNAYGETDMQAAGGSPSLPVVAFEVAEGDPLLALAYVLDVLEAKREAAEVA